jgi:hypothetical protein
MVRQEIPILPNQSEDSNEQNESSIQIESITPHGWAAEGFNRSPIRTALEIEIPEESV